MALEPWGSIFLLYVAGMAMGANLLSRRGFAERQNVGSVLSVGSLAIIPVLKLAGATGWMEGSLTIVGLVMAVSALFLLKRKPRPEA